jgi:hypothetical protein
MNRSSAPVELRSPAHLWQLGLASSQGREHEDIAVLLTRTHSLKQFFAAVQMYLGPELRMVPFDRAQVTLTGPDDDRPLWVPGDFQAGQADVTKIQVTGYSIRLVPEQAPFVRIASAFGLPKPALPYGVDLCYPLASISATRTNEVSRNIEMALLERGGLSISWEFVEFQRRPLASREPFGYERLDSRRGRP